MSRLELYSAVRSQTAIQMHSHTLYRRLVGPFIAAWLGVILASCACQESVHAQSKTTAELLAERKASNDEPSTRQSKLPILGKRLRLPFLKKRKKDQEPVSDPFQEAGVDAQRRLAKELAPANNSLDGAIQSVDSFQAKPSVNASLPSRPYPWPKPVVSGTQQTAINVPNGYPPAGQFRTIDEPTIGNSLPSRAAATTANRGSTSELGSELGAIDQDIWAVSPNGNPRTADPTRHLPGSGQPRRRAAKIKLGNSRRHRRGSRVSRDRR